MDGAQSTFISSTYWTEAVGPAAALGLPAPTLAPGAPARVALLRLAPWTVRAADFASKSRNTPMLGRTFPLRPVALLAPEERESEAALGS